MNGVQVDSTPFVPAQPMASLALSQYTQLTFEEYAVKILNEGVGKATTRTIEGHRLGIRPMVELIGHKKMVDLTTQDLKKAFEVIRYKYLKSNVTRSFNITRLMIQTAFENGEIPTDIIGKMKCPTSKKPIETEKFPTYSEEEIATLLKTSREYSLELYTMFALLECTGMRPGEMRGLEWSVFDAEKKTIRIKQAATVQFEKLESIRRQAKAKDIISVPKSAYSVRTLRLSDLAVKALLEWNKYLSKSRNQKRAESPYIFPNAKGNFKSETSCQSIIQRYRAEFHLEGVTFYKFRHTMCTRLILSGQPISVIQRIMGDNTTDVIMKVYTHVNAEMAMKATEGFYDELNKRHIGMMA